MKIRVAETDDIPSIQVIRNLVKENRLSDPSLISNSDVGDYIARRGKGWVCEINNEIIGFAIADLIENNIGALFIHPGYERRGIGRKLHDEMLNWYFSQTGKTIWLGTSPKTRAELFYCTAGWKEVGVHGKDEIKFEMTKDKWESLQEQ